jgi:transposase
MHGWRLYNVNNLKLARFKEIFPAPAKTDAIDARRMLELFALRDQVPMARKVLQEVAAAGKIEQQLKALTRRRKQLVGDRIRLSQRMQSDLQAACPGLLAITGQADNWWFLNFLGLREDLTKLKSLRQQTLLATPGIGKAYVVKIRQWQHEAVFSPEIGYLGPMIVADARQMLALRSQILALERDIEALIQQSDMARRIRTIPGFGPICAAELAGEIGTIERFAKADSLAMYLGVAPLDHSSGRRSASKVSKQINHRARDALFIGTVRHMPFVPTSKAYYTKKRAAGKTHLQSVRATARVLAKVLFAMLKHSTDYQVPTPPTPKPSKNA